MNLLKNTLIAPTLALLLCTSLNAEERYTIDTLSLKEAIESISKKANIPYIVDSKLLVGKKANKIENVEGIKNALDKILENSDLEATILDGTIVIKKKKVSQSGAKLGDVDVIASSDDGTAEQGYLVKDISGIGIFGTRNLQDTPYSMTVISEDLIQNVQANDMAQIFKMNPVTQDGGDQQSGFYKTVIRGFSSDNAVINGMPMANYYSFVTMEDLERVETINGATGFLYGGGRVGGAVNYVTKKPTIEDKRSITIGNYGGDQYYGHIDLGGQIDEENIFGYRVNALYQDGDSVAGVNKEQKFVSLVFDYKPTDDFIMDLKYSHRELKRSNQKLNYSLNAGASRPTIDVRKNYSPDLFATDEENDRLSTSLKWNINDIFSLRSSFLYEESDRIFIGNAFAIARTDGLYDSYLYKWVDKGQEYKNWSGSLYLDSKFETSKVEHLLTIGYTKNNYKYSRTINAYTGESLTGVSLNEIKNAPLPNAIIPNTDFITWSETQYKNILIGDDITFNDQWSTLVGVNYATVENYSPSSGTYDKSAVTPTLSLMYKPFEDLTTYVTYMESLEAGSIVGDTYSNAGEMLDPLVSKQYELGAKYSLSENLLLSSALFRIEKANQYSDNAAPMPKYVQDGEQIHQGIELTITGKVSDNLTIMAGGTLMDLSIEESNNPDLVGKKPTNAASKMAKLYTEYNIPQINGLTLTGGAYYTGEKWGDTTNTDKIPSYTLYDAGLRYKTKINTYPTTLNLAITNLTGEDYWASNTILGDPRSVAFSMKMEF